MPISPKGLAAIHAYDDSRRLDNCTRIDLLAGANSGGCIAINLGLNEREEDLDRSMYLFERLSQGIIDVLLAWMLPAAALMMLLGNQYWPILALVGGGIYLYFPGVFIITRIVLKRNGMNVGRPASVVSAYLFGTLCMLSAIYMIVLAVTELGSAV